MKVNVTCMEYAQQTLFVLLSVCAIYITEVHKVTIQASVLGTGRGNIHFKEFVIHIESQ